MLRSSTVRFSLCRAMRNDSGCSLCKAMRNDSHGTHGAVCVERCVIIATVRKTGVIKRLVSEELEKEEGLDGEPLVSGKNVECLLICQRLMQNPRLENRTIQDHRNRVGNCRVAISSLRI